MKCWFLWYEFSENIYSLCKIYKYWQQIAEQQIVTAYLCQHVYRYQKICFSDFICNFANGSYFDPLTFLSNTEIHIFFKICETTSFNV